MPRRIRGEPPRRPRIAGRFVALPRAGHAAHPGLALPRGSAPLRGPGPVPARRHARPGGRRGGPAPPRGLLRGRGRRGGPGRPGRPAVPGRGGAGGAGGGGAFHRGIRSKIPEMADLPLSLLCNELTSRGNDGRPALATLDPLTLFYRTAGETPASFHRGTEVKATVTRLQGDQRALLRLDNGLPGYLDRADFPAGDADANGGNRGEGGGLMYRWGFCEGF